MMTERKAVRRAVGSKAQDVNTRKENDKLQVLLSVATWETRTSQTDRRYPTPDPAHQTSPNQTPPHVWTRQGGASCLVSTCHGARAVQQLPHSLERPFSPCGTDGGGPMTPNAAMFRGSQNSVNFTKTSGTLTKLGRD